VIRIYLTLAAVILALILLNKFIKTSPEIISRGIKKIALLLLLLGVILLAATGRLNWIFALLGVLIAFSLRMLPYIMRYIPQLHSLWAAFNKNKYSSSASDPSRPGVDKMTKEEALQILGLAPSASDQDVILAHRKLIQKLHPDRGGSDYLAAKINQAKKVLLRK